MDSRPPYLLLFLTSLLHFRQCAGVYTIDTVGLTILPSRTVESGTPVTLSCKVSTSHDPSLHLRHEFQFLRYDVAVYSFTTTDTEVLYQLDPARAADSGAYECHVKVKEKSRTSIPQKLTVTGLQTPVLQLSKTELYESEELIAICSAAEEKGSLIFHFYQEFRSGAPRKIKQVGPSGNSTETKLVLRNPGDSYLYCDYEIPTLPEAGHSNSSNKIQVIVKGLYISPIMNVLPSTSVFEGDIIEVVCKVVNPPSNIDVFLSKDKIVLKKSSVSLSHRYTAKSGESGELVCKAEWGSAQKETYVTVTIKDLFSNPHLTMEPIDLFEGEVFELSCAVSSFSRERINNETMQFSIYRDHVLLTKTDTYTARADSSRNGNYTCKAQATSQSKIFVKESEPLVIKAKVPVSQPILSVVGDKLVVGEPFLLQCHSERGSLPITYTLYGPSRLPEVRVVSRPGDQAIFNTSAIQKNSDIPKFLCQAKNNDFNPPMKRSGQQLLHTTTIIEPVSTPVLTMYPTMNDIAEGQDLTLVCSVQSGTPPISFTWYHIEKEEPLAFKTPVGLKGSFTIQVKMAGWKKGLIAVFCILLTVALILVIVIKKGLLPFKRTRTGELSVKSAGTKAERLSLTQAEVNEAANVTPGVMGKSVWSEHVSGSESDDQNSVASPEEPETQYTEVQTKQVHPSRVPVKKGTDTVYSEVQNSNQGAPEQADILITFPFKFKRNTVTL
ncbi:platelet endothelial cell adhesion molecule [Diretmus argenteus]